MTTSGEDSHVGVSLDPLTRRNSAGQVYVRASDVELQILQALALPPATMRKRVAIAKRASSEYLTEECLVYLLRHYSRLGDNARVNDLAAALLRRCTAIIRKHLRTLGPEALEEGYSEIITRLFCPILDIATDKADYLQVRFWVVMERLCIQEFNRQLRHHDRRQEVLSFSQLPGYNSEDDGEAETKSVRLTEEDKRRVSVPSDEKAIVERDLRRVALTQLEEPFRSAFLLRHCEGWPIEHQDPAVPTISRHLGRTPRTIRNWLATAEKTLTRWRGGQR